MISYVVYSYYEAFIEDDDDVVAGVAQGQLVLVYFAALAIFTSEVSEQKRGVFSGAAFGATLIVVFFASFIVALYAIVLEVFGHRSIRYAYSQVIFRSNRIVLSARRRMSSSYFSSASSGLSGGSSGLSRGASSQTDDDEANDDDPVHIISGTSLEVHDEGGEDVPGAGLNEGGDEATAAARDEEQLDDTA